jgi:SAM-dependent methyltransferase
MPVLSLRLREPGSPGKSDPPRVREISLQSMADGEVLSRLRGSPSGKDVGVGVPDESTDLEDGTSLNRSTYDRIAQRYVENQIRQESGNNNLFASLQEAFLMSLPAGGVVADLGCGPARDGARFAAEGFRVVGMDLSSGMLAASELAGRLVQADLRAIPIAGSALDGIWSTAALLHVPERDTDQVLREFRRALHRAGTLALVTALGESSRLEAVPYVPSEQRWYVYRRSEILRHQLESAGFAIRTEEQMGGTRVWCAILASAL